MSSARFDVVFLPENRRYSASGPVALYHAAAGAGILVEQPCGSQGICGHCRVRVARGQAPPSDADAEHLSPSELAAGWRLACQLVLDGPVAIEVPIVARSVAGKSFGDELPADALALPVIDLACVPLPTPPVVQTPAIDRVAAALGRRPRSLRASPRALTELSQSVGVFREVLVALQGDEVVSARPGGLVPLFGLALDIGTTSLAAALVRLTDGAVVMSASELNPQVAMGADVIARIQHAIDDPAGLDRLTSAVRGGLQSLARRVIGEAGCHAKDVVAAAVAGNPTMLHAWAGVDLRSLGIAPYVGTWSGALECRAHEIGLPIHPNAGVYAFPQVRSHVGGDAVAAAIACGIDRTDGCRLLVDLGTNSEVLVTCGDRVVATSAAAGPAFEGVSIRHGMRAASGAVDVVSFTRDDRVAVNTIGGTTPRGICGSGLIDLVAEMLRAGLIAPSGYLRRREELDPERAGAHAGRVFELDGQQAFVFVRSEDWTGASDLVLTARDVREVQLAKGSILTAATLACRHLGIDVGRLDEVLVAGAFGNFVRKASARRIGLVPGIDPERVRLVGNAAGIGARLALLDRDVRDRARRLAERAEYVDLATRPDYQATFMEMLPFPEGN